MDTEWHCEVAAGLCVLPRVKTCWYYLLIHPPPLRYRQSLSALWSALPRSLTAHSSTPKNTPLHGRSDTFYSFCRELCSCRVWFKTIKKPLKKIAWWHHIDFSTIRITKECAVWLDFQFTVILLNSILCLMLIYLHSWVFWSKFQASNCCTSSFFPPELRFSN